ELVSSKYAYHAFPGIDNSVLAQPSKSRDCCGGRWLATEAARAHLRLGIEHFLISHLAHAAATCIERSQRFGQINRPVDFDCTGQSRGPNFLHIQRAKVAINRILIWPSAIPSNAKLVMELKKRVGAGRVYHSQARRPCNQPKFAQFQKRFTK